MNLNACEIIISFKRFFNGFIFKCNFEVKLNYLVV